MTEDLTPQEQEYAEKLAWTMIAVRRHGNEERMKKTQQALEIFCEPEAIKFFNSKLVGCGAGLGKETIAAMDKLVDEFLEA